MDQSFCCAVAALTQKYEGHFYASTSTNNCRAKSCFKAWQLPKAVQGARLAAAKHAASSSVEQLGSSYVIELSLKFSNLNGKVWKGYWSFWASRLLKKMRLYDTKTLHHCMSDPRGKREGNDAAFCTHMPLIKKDKPIFLHSCRAWVSTPFFTTPWNIYYLLSTFSQRIKKRVSTLLL